MHIGQIWRYPVKSMIGETVACATYDDLGMLGDRRWATRDQQRGDIRGAKHLGGLMRFVAASVGDGNDAVITLPDGSSVLTCDPDVDERISAALNHPVLLQHLRPSADLDHYRRGPSVGDPMANLRAVFDREEGEPVPDLSSFPPVIMEFATPPGSYVDVHPLMIMTTSALRSLQESVPNSVVDVRRFRPSLIIDTGDEPGHPEFTWVGRQLHVGEAVFEVLAPCPRCVMVTRAVDDTIPQDRTILRHIVKELDQNVGVYARVAKGATIALDEAVVLSS